MRMCIAPLLAALVLLAASPSVQGAILIRQAEYNPAAYGYGGSSWGDITNYLNSATGGAVTEVANFENAVQVDAADALWIDLGGDDNSFQGMSATEIANITDFISSGRRVVMIGENTAWSQWVSQILGLVGGTLSNASSFGYTATAVAHPLTGGVSGISVQNGGQATVALGGTSLFTQNVATLWGDDQNVLTILDVNVFSNDYINEADNRQFTQNTVAWLAAEQDVVPEPSSCAVFLGVALCCGAAGWRKKRREMAPHLCSGPSLRSD